MRWDWLKMTRRLLIWWGALLLASAGVSRAEEPADLKKQLDEQAKQIQELKDMLQKQQEATKDDKKCAAKPLKVEIDEDQVKKLIDSYLGDKPGIGMPKGVQMGYQEESGFYLRSQYDPNYANWTDQGAIPFEMRIHGRIQADYYYYKTADSINHQTGLASGSAVNPFQPGGPFGTGPGPDTAPYEASLLVERGRIWFEGTLFDPDIQYRLMFDGNTRGLNTFNVKQGFFGTATAISAGTTANSIGSGQNVGLTDNAVRLFEAWGAYVFHGAPTADPNAYRPSYRLVVGKFKQMFSIEEYMGSGNQQFVEYSMANWYFDADDDNLMMGAGVQINAFDDRLFFSATMTNGNETQTPFQLQDNLPGAIIGGWWDFGGTYNDVTRRWQLFGPSLSDIDWSPNLVVRVGGAVNLVPMGRRSQYTSLELDRARVAQDTPDGGGTLTSVLGGGGTTFASIIPGSTNGTSPFAVDAFDSYTYEGFLAAHYRGWSFYTDWFLRDLDHFRGTQGSVNAAGTALVPGHASRSILYSAPTYPTGATTAALFPGGSLVDYGAAFQAGYFLIPQKLEVAARFSFIRGESGDINGSGNLIQVTNPAIVSAALTNPGILGPGQYVLLNTPQKIALGLAPTVAAGTAVRVVGDAFRKYHESQEIAVGVNYFIYKELIKWQTDVGLYRGGNPAANGQAAAGFVPGVDGWLVRSQFQIGW